ncbi:hypothetical protein GGS23DRAFT_595397 [Durotheca rogersii]|uniref:uncharacterized protein n=1 Tax=Durotheca rogersii TaxID=419775 RepID=UPI00221F92E0|nr:uncharacterized protein GGS23DRAFT_595397 [Durotheca rogersii]KAI5864685.1 hypothetical protein GGS23DRAFT_595397 [Durotheca rogersii]
MSLLALEWYQESKWKHIKHAFTQPFKLRFNDIVQSITALSQEMTAMDIASSYLEQREIRKVVQELQALITRVINEPPRVDFLQQPSEIHLDQIRVRLASVPLPDPVEAFQASLFLSNRQRQRPSNWGPAFLLNDKIRDWNRSPNSSLVMDTGIPVIWALKTMMAGRETDTGDVSTIDLLKYLIVQAVVINKKIRNFDPLNQRIQAYQNIGTEDQ